MSGTIFSNEERCLSSVMRNNVLTFKEINELMYISAPSARRGYIFKYIDFSLFKTITQRVIALNYNPPAMRVVSMCYTKKSPIRYNIVVQATIVRKDGDFNG